MYFLLLFNLNLKSSHQNTRTGNRFTFEGIYNGKGERVRDFLQLGTHEWHLMTYAATSLAMQASPLIGLPSSLVLIAMFTGSMVSVG